MLQKLSCDVFNVVCVKLQRDRVIKYNVYVEESDSATNTVKLGGFEGFSKAVSCYFGYRALLMVQ
jgi:hypothetical protein